MSKEENTSLIPNVESSLSTNNDVFDGLSTTTTFLSRLQLYSKGKAIMEGKVGIGNLGIPDGDDVIDLGASVDVIVLARRAKAIDMNDTKNIIQSFDANSDTFKDIQQRAAGQNSGCMFGISFLVLERTTGRFLEYFAGTKTARSESKKLFPFLAEVQQANGAEYIAPVSISSRLIDNGKFTWHAPVFNACSTPIELPAAAAVEAELTRFLNPDTSNNGEIVSEEEQAAVAGRAR